jgi:hypothetical protein
MFLELWEQAGRFSPQELARARRPRSSFVRRIGEALALDSALGALEGLGAALRTADGTDAEAFRGEILATMRAIDEAFYAIHPRATIIAPAAGPRPRLPAWLRDARDRRLVTASYAEHEGHRLVPRGPLLRSARQPLASAAESLADRFAALTVSPSTLQHEERPVRITQRVIPASTATGVAPGSNVGAETVAFVPLAEVPDDLSIREVLRGGMPFADCGPAAGFDPAERLIAAIKEIGTVDLVVAPELLVPEAAADRLGRSLVELERPPRMVVAGSGHTSSTRDDQPFNESRVLNGCGAELWRQRKVWPAGLGQWVALKLGLSDPGETGRLMEDNAADDEIIVADADGLGRCLILICQDLQTQPLTGELIRIFQPDWVFTPILDHGADAGRWAHQRIFDLSSLSHARFLVSCCTALAERLEMKKEVMCGLAAGPRASTETDIERAVLSAAVQAGTEPGFATIAWGADNWMQSTLATTSPAKVK